MAKATLPDLRRDLRERLSRPLPERAWSGPPHMARAAGRIAALLDGAVPEPIDPERLAEAVARLERDDELTAGDIRLCCAGATTPVALEGEPRAIVDSHDLTDRLLGRAQAAAGRLRMWRRCAFGIAHALLLPVRPPDEAAVENAQHLWDFVVTYARRPTDTPSSDVLTELLPFAVERSTHQFWPYVLERDAAAVSPLIRLGVAPTSWVWREIVLDAIREASSWSDAQFASVIDPIMDSLEAQEATVELGLGRILDRYARSASAPERARLRDVALSNWGSPLIAQQIPHWDRWTSEQGRRLVAGWLARQVISTFFGALSAAGTDERRMRFWSRYADRADELHIYLSYNTRTFRGQVVRELREVLGSNVRQFHDEETDAFIIVLGGYAFVEFSMTGNALYVYERDSLPFRLDHPHLNPPRMKDRDRATRWLPHQGSWEIRVRDVIGELTGLWVRL